MDVEFDRIVPTCLGSRIVWTARPATTFALLALAFLPEGCQLVGGYEDFERSEPIPAESLPELRRCDALPPAKTSVDDPLLRDPVLRLVDDPYGTCFWMDETEVTVGQYREWLMDLGQSAPDWTDAAACDRREPDVRAFDPDDPVGDCRATAASGSEPPFADEQPMRCVDWCEAAAYCQWAGKRLCKGRSPIDEWRIACSAGYTEEYPFDPRTPGGACNYGQVGCSLGCGTRFAGQEASCRPAYGYPRDLGGNVEEWIDECIEVGDGTSLCGFRGGSYLTPEHKLKCSYNLGGGFVDSRDPRVGFRCCATLTSQESVLAME
jgi:hypothetical protein